MAGVIVLDAGVLIGHFQNDDAFHDAASGFLEENEEFDFAITAMTMAECLVHSVPSGHGTRVVGLLERLHVLRFDLTDRDALGLAEVRARTRLRMPDALVLYTAERHGAELVTTDRTLARVAEGRGVTVSLLAA